jgi:hypothetical protein
MRALAQEPVANRGTAFHWEYSCRRMPLKGGSPIARGHEGMGEDGAGCSQF